MDFSSDSIYDQLTDRMSQEFANEFQKYALHETDETKLSIILSSYRLRETLSILLYKTIDKQVISNFIDNMDARNLSVFTLLMPAIVANNDEENFLNLVDKDFNSIVSHSLRKFYFTCAKYNKTAIVWLRDIQKDFQPITYLLSLTAAVIDSPDAIIWSKYVFDFVLEKMKYNKEELRKLFGRYIGSVTFGGNVQSKMPYYEILFQTGYFSYDYLIDLYKQTGDPVLKEWLGMTDI